MFLFCFFKRFSIEQNKTKCANFRANPRFQSYVENKTRQNAQIFEEVLFFKATYTVREFPRKSYESSFEREDFRKFSHFVLFCPMEKRSF